MAYLITNAYKDTEQILKRTMNSFEIMKIETWFSRYDADYLEWAFSELKKMTNVYSTNFIDSYLFRNYESFTRLKDFFSSKGIETTQPIIQEQTKQEEQKKEYINDWDEHDEETKAYWLAKLRYAFCPNEYPNPDL